MTTSAYLAGGTSVASLGTGGDRGVGHVAVHPLLPGARHHLGPAGADPAPPAQRGRRGAHREGVRRPAVRPAEADSRRAPGGPPLPHPVPEGLPAPRAPALRRPQRAPDPGRVVGDRPAQPRPATGRGAGQALRGEGREVQDAAPGRGRSLPGRRGGQGGHRGASRHRRDRLRRRVPDRREPPGPPGRDRAEPNQAGPGASRHAPAGPHRPPGVRPGHARRHRGREAEEDRRPQGGAAARGPDGRAGAAHRQPGQPDEDDGGDGRPHPDLQQEAHGPGAQRARLPRRLRHLRPALGGRPRSLSPSSCSTSTTSRTTTTRTATSPATSSCRSSPAS